MKDIINNDTKFKKIIFFSIVSFLLIIITLLLPTFDVDHNGYPAFLGQFFFLFEFNGFRHLYESVMFILVILLIGLLLFSIFYTIRQVILICKKESKLSVKTYMVYQIIYVVYNVLLFVFWILIAKDPADDEFLSINIQPYRYANIIISIMLIVLTVYQLVYLIMKKKKIANNK